MRKWESERGWRKWFDINSAPRNP